MRNHKKWPLTAVFSAVMLCCSAPVFAGQEDLQSEQKPLQEEVMSSSTEESSGAQEDAYTLGTVVVTATRQAEEIMEVPATVNVITQRAMEQHVVTNISELVRYEPGVTVKKTVSGTDPFGNLTGFTIRGVGGNRVQMLVDGSRVIESIQDGNRDFVDLSMMKSVEIVRGPGSVLWGADAMSGIVSYQTMDPEDLLKGRNAGAKVGMSYDSFNKGQSYTAMVAAQMTPTLQGIAGYTYRKYEEARFTNARADGGIWGCTRIGMGCDKLNPLDGHANNFMTKLVWSPNTYHQVKFTGETFVSKADVEQLFDKYQTSMGIKNSGDYLRHQKQSRWRLGIEHEWLVDAGWLDELKWRLSYSPQKRELTDSRVQTLASGQERATYRDTNYSEDFLQADIQLTSRFQVGPSDHELTYGFQGDTTKSKYDRVTTTANLTTGVSTTVKGGGLDFTDAKTKRYDLFMQDEMTFANGMFSVTPGVRWANYKIEPSFDDTYVVIPGKEPQNISSHKLIPQITFAFKPDSEYMLYARYAEGFKMPTVQQLYTSYAMATLNIVPNPDLKAETVKSYEIGVKRAYQNNWWSTAVYLNDYEDFIKSQQLIPGTTKDYTALNISKVKIWGIEASAGLELHRNWRLNTGISYMHGKQRDNDDDGYTPFDGASPINGYLGVQWLSPQRVFDVELISNFSGPVTRTVSDDKFKPAGYTTFDGYFNWNVTKNAHFTLGVLNIFDKRYFVNAASSVDRVPASASSSYTMPLELYTGAGRTFSVGLNIDF